MGMRNATVYRWRCEGIADSRDSVSSRPGACQTITNLLFDPADYNTLFPRPAVTQITNFTGFTSPGAVSLLFTFGTRIYGLLATARNAGHDEPFVYDTATGAFVTVGGVTAGNTPTSPATTGDWTPPQAAMVGSKIVVTHPGFSGANRFGWFDISNPAAPTWNAGNTAGAVVLASTPIAVGSFYNRAWFSLGNTVVFSDPLNPTQVTNAGQAVTCGDSLPVTCLVAIPLTTGTQGILSALLLFKNNSIWQVTGDYASNSLLLNQLSSVAGTLAPLTVQATPYGVLFMAADGLRSVSSTGEVSPPQSDLVYYFLYASTPSRACAAYAGDVYRICFDATPPGGLVTRYDYWYHLKKKQWTGPHSFLYQQADAIGNRFVLFSSSLPGALQWSNFYPSGNDTYIENGQQMSIEVRSRSLTLDPPMAEHGAVEMSVNYTPGPSNYIVNVLAGNASLVGSGTLQGSSAGGVWGSGTWGTGTWSAPAYNLLNEPVYFSQPLAFKQAAFQVTGSSGLGMRLGHISLRYQPLGYTGRD